MLLQPENLDTGEQDNADTVSIIQIPQELFLVVLRSEGEF